MVKLLHTITGIAMTYGACLAGPITSDTLSVSGEVVSVVWIDQVKFKSDGAGLMASGTKACRHYIILESGSGTVDQRDQLSGILLFGLSKWPHWSVAKVKLTESQVMIEIPGKLIPSLVKGATVKVKNYRVTGDEWCTDATFDELEVDGQKIEAKAEQAGTGQSATRTESKSEGADKPQTESEGCSR